ncbi:MAG TPA: M48 family metalloprotease [Burkholderiales bacterium]|nr:M48 family metalloprotease [Burkholderiales bacterium]
MMESQEAAQDRLQPLAYQREVVAFLKRTEPELWHWASSAQAQTEYADGVRTQLLKDTYRLDADAHRELATSCAAVASLLGIDAPVTLYQTGGAEMNAMLWYLPGEAHVIFTGPVLSVLRGAELRALLGHELAHYRLWRNDGGEIHIADRLLGAAASDPRAAASHVQTARRFRLYTEIYADRGSLVACGDLEPAVAALVKTQTGLTEVSAAAYLRQADEIFARFKGKTEGIDHPETFVRARALRLWHEGSAELDRWLADMIEGRCAVDELDVLGQARFATLTRRFIAALLRPHWFFTDATGAHARQFFADFSPAASLDESLIDELKGVDAATREYLCYLLLDFAAVDPDLEELPLAAALDWSRRLGFEEEFEKLALKELGLGKRQLGRLKKDGAALLAKAEARHG